MATVDNERCPAHADLENGCIRLLQIQHGAPDTELCCRLFVVSIHDDPRYTALSYTWGRPTAVRHTVRLNGHVYLVRKNLWRFLRQARTMGISNPDDLLWIDALCINQSDISERTSQLTLIPQIYTKARQVTVWLGPTYGGSDRVMGMLSKPQPYWRSGHHLARLWSRPAGTAFVHLCRRPYWTRLWIFQELMLARAVELLCGGDVTTWRSFRDFTLRALESTPHARDVDTSEYELFQTSPALAIVKQTQRPLEHTTLWDLMLATRQMRCAEVKDRVYALLGVATGGGARFVVADYDAPLPTTLNRVLRGHHELHPPRDVAEVEAQCARLAALVGLGPDAMFAFRGQLGAGPPPLPAQLDIEPLANPRSRVSLWWSAFFSHAAVTRVLSPADWAPRGGGAGGSERWYRSEWVVRLLLEHGVGVDDFRVDGRSLLCLAAEEGRDGMVGLLLGRGQASVNEADAHGFAPLHYAVARGHARVVRLLLGSGDVDVNVRDPRGLTALHYAVLDKLPVFIDLLFDCDKAVFDVMNRRGMTPFFLAPSSHRRAIAELLLDTDAVDVNRRGPDGLTPLHVAVMEENVETVRLLLRTGKCSLHQKDQRGWTARDSIPKKLWPEMLGLFEAQETSGDDWLGETPEGRSDAVLDSSALQRQGGGQRVRVQKRQLRRLGLSPGLEF